MEGPLVFLHHAIVPAQWHSSICVNIGQRLMLGYFRPIYLQYVQVKHAQSHAHRRNGVLQPSTLERNYTLTSIYPLNVNDENGYTCQHTYIHIYILNSVTPINVPTEFLHSYWHRNSTESASPLTTPLGRVMCA